MSTSLKAYIPTLANYLRSTPAALYERQRALVSGGFLTGGGRGPGAGVRASADSIALLLVAVLATDSLSDTVPQMITFGAALPLDGKCPFTQQAHFARALAEILGSLPLSAKVEGAEVGRTTGTASIYYLQRTRTMASLFEARAVKQKLVPLDVRARLHGDVIKAVARDVVAITGEKG